MTKRQMRLADLNREVLKIADKTESPRTVESSELIASSDHELSTCTGADTVPSTSSNSGTSKKKDSNFKKNWLIKFPWLQESDGNIKCKTCLEYNLKLVNTFVTVITLVIFSVSPRFF